jgi:hypothetical protein
VKYCGTGMLDGDTFTCNENRVLFSGARAEREVSALGRRSIAQSR